MLRLTILLLAAMAYLYAMLPVDARRGGFLSTTGSFQLSSGGGGRASDMARNARGNDYKFYGGRRLLFPRMSDFGSDSSTLIDSREVGCRRGSLFFSLSPP